MNIAIRVRNKIITNEVIQYFKNTDEYSPYYVSKQVGVASHIMRPFHSVQHGFEWNYVFWNYPAPGTLELKKALRGHHGRVPTLPAPHILRCSTRGDEDHCYSVQLTLGFRLGLRE